MKCIISGEVLETIPRKFPSGDPYVQVRLLCGKADVISVNFVPDRFTGEMPREGESVDLGVNVSAFVSKRTGAAGLGIDATHVRLSEPVTVQ